MLGDIEEAEKIACRVEAYDSALSATLRALIRRYEFDQLLDYIGSTAG